MGTNKIPKLARNKYNFVKGADGNYYSVVQTGGGLMMSSGGGGNGGGSGTNNNTTQYKIKTANEVKDLGFVTYNDIKTINGYSLIGTGDIEITSEGTVDLSAYATKTYVDTKLVPYAQKSYVVDYVAAYAPTADLSSYVTYTYLDNELNNYTRFIDIEGMSYATTTYVTTNCEDVKNASYAYAYSIAHDSENTGITYAECENMIMQTINAMIATGALVSYSTVQGMISDSRV